MRALLALCLATVTLACAKRDDRPDWAKPPEGPGGTAGEATLTGEPLGVTRFATAPTLDGKLDEPMWKSAHVLGPLVLPGNGEAADKHPVSGFAKLGWDDRALYLGVVVGDRTPSSPFGRDDVDPHIWERSSAIELMLQPGDPGDNREYYELQIDVAGAVFDTRWDDYNKPIVGEGAARKFGHMEWSSKTERAIHVVSDRFYAVEAAIPWASFEKGRFATPPKSGDVFRINVYTFRDGQRQALAWSPLRGQGNFHRSSRFGRIRFE